MKDRNTHARLGPPERTRFKLGGRSVALDTRIHASRGDLADVSLAGVLFSAHYARAVELTCVASGSALLASPSMKAQAVSELLRGETFHALDVTADWAWGFCSHDGYVGYIRREALDVREVASHRIIAQTAPLFSGADIKSPILDYWPQGALFTGEETDDFLASGEGHIHIRHASAVDMLERDWVAVAQRYLGQPYIWGGRGHRGIDCSGLVQVALGQCGIKAPRDTDMQREGIGASLTNDTRLVRGDFVFFPGHVGMMVDETSLLHANAHWMAVVVEPLADVVARLAGEYEQPILARRRISA